MNAPPAAGIPAWDEYLGGRGISRAGAIV